MLTLLVWCVLFVVCWPLALLALVLYPVVWLLLLPFRIVGVAVEGVLSLVWTVLTLPARLLGAEPRRRASHRYAQPAYPIRRGGYPV